MTFRTNQYYWLSNGKMTCKCVRRARNPKGWHFALAETPSCHLRTDSAGAILNRVGEGWVVNSGGVTVDADSAMTFHQWWDGFSRWSDLSGALEPKSC